ncbi:MAG: SLBB domain-containing protein, partial [Armatimonadetes bacterium]|nr:SLBB domain-containing protein [Armatimonadota bacterium]
VTKPGPVKLGSNGKLLDALSEAGPLTANADPKRISILRKGVEKPELYDLDSVSNDRALNAALRAGDTITVPAKGSYTVQIDGEVRTAGMRSLDSANTLAAAVLAAGPNENADWSRVLLRRKGSAIPEEVDLSQVRAGTAKDEITLQPGDQITVLSRVLGNAKVIGEVKTSGDKPITGKTFLLDFIGTAGGGFSEKADPMRVEIRRPGQEPRTFDLMPVMRGEKISTDPEMEIRPGDTVFVPNGEKTRFHIVGGVNKGGSFPVQPGMNLIDAITMAEGFKPSATKKALVIAPDDPNDERLKTNAAPVKKSKKKSAEAAPAQGLIVVDLKKLIDGDGAQNVEIKQGDQILVPEDGVPIQREKVPFIDRVLRMLPLYGLFSGR